MEKQGRGGKPDVVTAFELHVLNMLCLGRLGDISAGLGDTLEKKGVTQWITGLLADTTVQQVSVYARVHDVTIVKQGDLLVAEHSFISETR